VDVQVKDRASTAFGADHPVRATAPGAGTLSGELQCQQPACRSTAQEIGQVLVLGPEANTVGHHKHHVLVSGRGCQHGVTIRHAERHGLLHQRVQVAFQGGNSRIAVEVGGEADIHGVHQTAGDEVTVVAEPTHFCGWHFEQAVQGAICLPGVHADVRRGYDLCVGHLPVLGQVMPADVAQTNDPDTQHVCLLLCLAVTYCHSSAVAGACQRGGPKPYSCTSVWCIRWQDSSMHSAISLLALDGSLQESVWTRRGGDGILRT